MSPAWLLQYVLVKDLQTGSSYYFLVEEWLSVDNDRTEGQVELKVEATGEREEGFFHVLSATLAFLSWSVVVSKLTALWFGFLDFFYK